MAGGNSGLCRILPVTDCMARAVCRSARPRLLPRTIVRIIRKLVLKTSTMQNPSHRRTRNTLSLSVHNLHNYKTMVSFRYHPSEKVRTTPGHQRHTPKHCSAGFRRASANYVSLGGVAQICCSNHAQRCSWCTFSRQCVWVCVCVLSASTAQGLLASVHRRAMQCIAALVARGLKCSQGQCKHLCRLLSANQPYPS